MKNSIVVSAYNEEKRSMYFIPNLIDFVRKTLPNSEIIIVNDGSTDRTRQILNNLAKSKQANSFVKVIGYQTIRRDRPPPKKLSASYLFDDEKSHINAKL